MKKIGIDARLYSQTGVGVYLRNLLFYLQRQRTNDHEFIIYVLKEDQSNVRNLSFEKRYVTERWHTITEQTTFLQRLNKDTVDLMHFTYFGYPTLYRKPFVSTIHDLTPLLFRTGKASTRNPLTYQGKYLAFRFVVSSQVKNSRFVITPTKAVKEQIVKTFGEQYEKKTIPLYEGVNRELLSAKENTKLKERFIKPFFLYVGNFYPHKNVERLIHAFLDVHHNVQLVLVGPKDFFANKLLHLNNKMEYKGRVIFFHNPTIEDFVFFYKSALALIHPSLSEGFGLPLVEAMYFNLPIIASHIPVFEEILEDKYIEFNPQNTKDITRAIEQFLKNKSIYDYNELLERYSFEEMTQKTVDVYRKALNM